MRKFLILLACVALSSCKHTKTLTEYKETLRIDTIKTEKIVEKFKAVHDTLTIQNPCDSSGLLSTFYSRLILPNGSVTIKSVKGQIKATIDIDSMRQEMQNNYRNSQVKWIEYRDKEVIKEVVPTWVIMLLFTEAIILVAYLYVKFGLRV
jgi:GTPase SAR1 family protein